MGGACKRRLIRGDLISRVLVRWGIYQWGALVRGGLISGRGLLEGGL